MKRTILLTLAVLAAPTAFADIYAVVEFAGVPMTVHFQDADHVRQQRKDGIGYSVVTHGRRYRVMDFGNGTVIAQPYESFTAGVREFYQTGELSKDGIEAQTVVNVDEAAGPAASEPGLSPAGVQIHDIGRSVTVAGIEGKAFLMSGEGWSATYILTDDERVVDFTAAVHGQKIEAMEGFDGKRDESEKLWAKLAAIAKTGYPGILRAGGYEVREVKRIDKPDSFYALPDDAIVVNDQAELMDALAK